MTPPPNDEQRPEQPQGQSKHPIFSPEAQAKLIPALLLVIVISFLSVLAMNALGGTEKVRALVAGSGAWAPAVFVLLKAATYVIAPLSGTPLRIVAGALFGVWEGLALTLVGDLLGGSLNFWIARLLGRPAIARFAGTGAIKQVDETMQHVGGWKALLLARLFLSSLYDFVSYAAGLSKLPFKHYLWVTLLGGIPGSLLYVFIGDRLTTGSGAPWFLLAAGVVLALTWWAQKHLAADEDGSKKEPEGTSER